LWQVRDAGGAALAFEKWRRFCSPFILNSTNLQVYVSKFFCYSYESDVKAGA
jgi:hypothetical protein